jgi:CMP-N,N'-diacetyllegionaminic acid synthase
MGIKYKFMYKNKKILAIITARGGSKGILRKNIKLLAGKPLIAYTIEAAKKSKYLTRCIVSTDDKEISNISEQYGADIPFLRPDELAQDESKSIDVIIYTVNKLEEYEKKYDYVMILQPTSPLRTSEDIDECIKKIVDTEADSVMSMMELSDFSLKKLKKIKNDKIEPYVEDEGFESSRRQDLRKVYKRNCAIYLTKKNLIMQSDLFGKDSRAHIMSNESSVDINELFDFKLAEFLLLSKNK